MSFWIIATLIAGLACAAIMIAMGRKRAIGSASEDIHVYRDQLAEVDRDLARGIIETDEAERARIEVSRRILDADRAAKSTLAPVASTHNKAVIALTGLLVFGGAFALYSQLGASNYPDLPLEERIKFAADARANRPSQSDVEATLGPVTIAQDTDPRMVSLMEKLRTALADKPDDLQGHVLLARNEAAIGNFIAAHQAQAQVIAIKGDAATAVDYANHADILVLAAGGYVSPEAERALARTLEREPENGTARYYSGLMFAQGGRADLALRLWRPLLIESQADDPWVEPIRSQIEQVAADAGVRYELPARGLNGPSDADIEAAQDMSGDERADMIKNMVANLSDRLATQGGSPEEWARLVNALGVLGDTQRATAIWNEAQNVFADAPDALEIVHAAAIRAGVAQ